MAISVAIRRGEQAWQSGVAIRRRCHLQVRRVRDGDVIRRERLSGLREPLEERVAAALEHQRSGVCDLGRGHTGDRREILGSSEGDQRERRDGRHLGTAERAAASSLVHKDGEGDHHVDKSNGLTCGERGTHTRSEAVIRGHQRPLEAIRSHQRSSEVRPSEAVIKRTQQAIGGHQRSSEAIKPAQSYACKHEPRRKTMWSEERISPRSAEIRASVESRIC